MKQPSRLTHIYRLLIVCAAGFGVFVVFVWLLTPPSWNYEIGYWFRRDSLEDMKRQPMIYGGIKTIKASRRNVACKSCHKELVKEFKRLKHKTVSCESCHGPLFEHARDGKKIADAQIDRSTWTCDNCHDARINRPKGFPQFRPDDNPKHQAFLAGKLEPGTVCLKCHGGHDPTP